MPGFVSTPVGPTIAGAQAALFPQPDAQRSHLLEIAKAGKQLDFRAQLQLQLVIVDRGDQRRRMAGTVGLFAPSAVAQRVLAITRRKPYRWLRQNR